MDLRISIVSFGYCLVFLVLNALIAEKFIIRIDDVHEGMDFVRFNDFINT